MAKIKRLILGIIPNNKCNLKCEYCYISQVDAWSEPEPLAYPVEHIARCLSVERLGGVSLINLTGDGETMLQPDIIPLTEALLREGHFVEIVTNGTITKHIREILRLPDDLLRRLFFKLSFHYRELLRLNILDKFFDNVKAIRDANVSYTIELMAYDAIESEIERIKAVCMENTGAVCQATIGRNDKWKDKRLLSAHSEQQYRQVWRPIDSPMLDFKLDVLGVKRREFCYAGDWSLFVNLYSGETRSCYWQPYNQNIFKYPEKPIRFIPVGHYCTQPYCVNAHAHLAWGLVPELLSPLYSDMRNRSCTDGTNWLGNDCMEFFSSKLNESNDEFSGFRKKLHSVVYPFRLVKWTGRNFKRNVHRINEYLKRT